MTAATAPEPPAAGHVREPRDERSSGTPSWMVSLRL